MCDCCKKQEITGPREFQFGNREFNLPMRFPTNEIRTSKQTALTYLPLALLIQFKRQANFYFLYTAVLQSIPQISPLNPFSAWMPLIFVLGLSMLREGIEDWKRHATDNKLNASPCQIYRNGKWEDHQWRELEVGDFILLKEMDVIPADIVVLSTSFDTGISQIETASLDGEKNLKPRYSPKETITCQDNKRPIVRIEGKIKIDQPSQSLKEFSGTMFLRGKRVLLGIQQLLYRGALLKNTKWAFGIVVHTGNDTKIIMNSDVSKFKQSQIEAKMNNLLIFILIFQSICCIFCAVANFLWNSKFLDSHIQLFREFDDKIEGVLSYFTYFLLYNTMIPISLIVTLEMVKWCQSQFINNDEDLAQPEKNRNANVYSCSINEELGQVEQIFSDKTGTLTCNQMEFKLCVIGHGMQGETHMLQEEAITRQSKARRPSQIDPKGGITFSFEDPKLQKLIKGEQSIENNEINQEIKNRTAQKTLHIQKTQSEIVREFIFLLATCHECLADKNDKGEVLQQGESPDEITLVDTARRLGFAFDGSSTSKIYVIIDGKRDEQEILKVFGFSSERKRGTIILKHQGLIKLFMKGADSEVKKRLSPSFQPYLLEADKRVNQFSKIGLRTLMIAMKVIEENEQEEFEKAQQIALESAKRNEEIGNFQ